MTEKAHFNEAYFTALQPGHVVLGMRVVADLTQQELAALTGVSGADIEAIEACRASLDLGAAKKLASALGIHSSSILFPGASEPPSREET